MSRSGLTLAILGLVLWPIYGCSGPPLEWSVNASENVCALFGRMDEAEANGRIYRVVIYQHMEGALPGDRSDLMKDEGAMMISISSPVVNRATQEEVFAMGLVRARERIAMSPMPGRERVKSRVFYLNTAQMPSLRELIVSGELRVAYETETTSKEDSINLGEINSALQGLDACSQ